MSADGVFYLAVIAAPLAGALVLALSGGRGACWVTLAAAPALAAAVRGPAVVVEYPGLLLGCRLGVDALGSVFLLFTAAVWCFAVLFASGYITTRRPGFYAALLTAMSGNFGLVLAQDMPTFYLFFALMSFASYGLVLHRRDDPARYAGKVYLVLVVAGEVLIFSGMIGLAHAAGETAFARLGGTWTTSPQAALIIGSLLLGFGIKAGALPLHVWLPLAHPAAPAPASAVLSGAMIKAGLLGWLRFLPVGEAALPGWGELLVLGGLAAALCAVPFGFFQRDAKTILAYSSISKMGLMTALVGLALLLPEKAPLAVAAVGLFAFDHALSKGTLFLGTSIHPGQCAGRVRRWLVGLGLAVPALGLAGFAGTGGLVAKTGMKKALAAYEGLLPAAWLSAFLFLASLGAVLLAARFLWVHVRRDPPAAPGRAAFWAWGLQTVLVLALPALYLAWGESKAVAKAFRLDALWGGAWPVLAASIAAAILLRRQLRPLPVLPAGDLLIWYAGGLRAAAAALTGLGRWVQYRYPREALARLRRNLRASLRADLFLRLEHKLGHPETFGALFLAVLAGFVLVLLLNR